MLQTLLPFANLSYEIMNNLKGRLKAVAILTSTGQDDEGKNDFGTPVDHVRVLLRWQDVPFMRELLRVRNCVYRLLLAPISEQGN